MTSLSLSLLTDLLDRKGKKNGGRTSGGCCEGSNVGRVWKWMLYSGVQAKHPCQKNSNNDIGSVIGLGPETKLISEPKELSGSSSVKLAVTILEHNGNRRMLVEISSVFGCHNDEEAVENDPYDLEYKLNSSVLHRLLAGFEFLGRSLKFAGGMVFSGHERK